MNFLRRRLLGLLAILWTVQLLYLVSFGLLPKNVHLDWIRIRDWLPPTAGWPFDLAALLFTGSILVGICWMIVSQTRRIVAADGQVCRRCGQDVRGTAVPVCPECGAPFDRDDLRRFWSHELRLRTPLGSSTRSAE